MNFDLFTNSTLLNLYLGSSSCIIMMSFGHRYMAVLSSSARQSTNF